MNSVRPNRSLPFFTPRTSKLPSSSLLLYVCVQVSSINFIDVEEYPAMAEIESRCVNMLARLFHAPLDNPESEACGVSTVGSSEAIILAVLAAKRRWKKKRQAEGKSVSSSEPPSGLHFLANDFGPDQTENPNIVMSAAVHVCWEKAARCESLSLVHRFPQKEKADELSPQISRSKRGTVSSYVPPLLRAGFVSDCSAPLSNRVLSQGRLPRRAAGVGRSGRREHGPRCRHPGNGELRVQICLASGRNLISSTIMLDLHGWLRRHRKDSRIARQEEQGNRSRRDDACVRSRASDESLFELTGYTSAAPQRRGVGRIRHAVRQ